MKATITRTLNRLAKEALAPNIAELLTFDLSKLPTDVFNKIKGLFGCGMDTDGTRYIKVKLTRQDGSPKYKKLVTVDLDSMSQDQMHTYSGQLVMPKALIKSINSVFGPDTRFVEYERVDTLEHISDYTKLGVAPTQAMHDLADLIHPYFESVLEAARAFRKSTSIYIPSETTYSAAPVCIFLHMYRQGIINGFEHCLHTVVKDGSRHIIGKITDLISAYLTQGTTRCSNNITNKYNEECFRISGNIIDHRIVSTIASDIIASAQMGGLYIEDPVTKQNITSQFKGDLELLGAVFNMGLTHRFTQWIENKDNFAKAANIIQNNGIDPTPWDMDDIPFADPNNLEEMKTAFLHTLRPHGKSPKGFYIPKPDLRPPEVGRGRPRVENRQIMEIRKQALEWARGELPAHIKRNIEKRNQSLKDALEIQARLSSIKPYNPLDRWLDDLSATNLNNAYTPLPLDIGIKAVLDVTTFGSDSEAMTLAELGHLGGNRKQWKNVIKVAHAYDLNTGLTIYFKIMRGNHSDQKLLEEMVDQLKTWGYKNLLIIADRGFSKELTHRFLSACGIHYIFMANNTAKIGQDARHKCVDHFFKHYDQIDLDNYQDGTYFCSSLLSFEEAGYVDSNGNLIDTDGELILDDQGKPWPVTAEYGTLTYCVFFNPDRTIKNFCETKKDVMQTLKELNDGKINYDSVTTKIKQFIKVEKDNSYSLKIEKVNTAAISEKSHACITNLPDADVKDVLSLYRLRWSIESAFRAVKYLFGSNSALYVQSEGSAGIKIGCLFVAVSLCLTTRTSNLHSNLMHSEEMEEPYSQLSFFAPSNFKRVRMDRTGYCMSGSESALGKVYRALNDISKLTGELIKDIASTYSAKTQEA